MADEINYADLMQVADDYDLNYNRFAAAYRAMLALSPQGSEPDGAQGGECPTPSACKFHGECLAPQATPAAVDDAAIERACRAFYGWPWANMGTMQEHPRAWMRDALTAALAAPPAEVKP